MSRAQSDLFEEILTSSHKRLRTFAEWAGLIADVDLRQVSLYAIFEAANRIEGKSQ